MPLSLSVQQLKCKWTDGPCLLMKLVMIMTSWYSTGSQRSHRRCPLRITFSMSCMSTNDTSGPTHLCPPKVHLPDPGPHLKPKYMGLPEAMSKKSASWLVQPCLQGTSMYLTHTHAQKGRHASAISCRTDLAQCFGFSIHDNASEIPVAFVVKITPSRKALACQIPNCT